MSELARAFGWHVAAIDYHLHVLRQAGFVVRRRASGHRYGLYLNGVQPRGDEQLHAGTRAMLDLVSRPTSL